MKYIKEYNKYVDPFDEDDWDDPPKPDGTFLTWLKIKYPNEYTWKDIIMIDCEYQSLTDLIGIEKLINLEYLHCNDNLLTELDISKNIKLIDVCCDNNQLINLYTNIYLIELICSNNKLTELDLSKNINLRNLLCDYNQLTELDVTKNINLKELFCNNNQLTELDLSKNIKLIYLHCYHNQLKELDISKNNKLKYKTI